MEYRHLGNSGLEVSRLGLGAIPFGTHVDEKAAQRIVDAYCDAGGNLIDTSNLYGGGMRGTNAAMAGTSEKTVGKVIKAKRDRLIVATKGYYLMMRLAETLGSLAVEPGRIAVCWLGQAGFVVKAPNNQCIHIDA